MTVTTLSSRKFNQDVSRLRADMRRLLMALAIALVTWPAYSQGMSKGHSKSGPPPEEKKTKPDDKGYNSAVGRMPDQKYDPWQTMRRNEPVKDGKNSK